MTKKILMPLPSTDFDPTESGVPWMILKEAGYQVTIATPEGKKPVCDPLMLHGTSLGPWKFLLKANADGVNAYKKMESSPEFASPISWRACVTSDFEGLLLAGGHAPGMKEYLESTILQKLVSEFFAAKKPVGAICHGVVLAARSKDSSGKSVLYGHKTTALLKSQEMSAWAMTALWLRNYYRTYPQSVEDEVKSQLRSPSDFLPGPPPLKRDDPKHLGRGFVVTSGNYISSRWPGDAHRFAHSFLELF